MVCKRVYEYEVEFKDQDNNVMKPTIRFISSNYEGSLYKLLQWCKFNNLDIIQYTLVGDYNAWE